MFDAIYGLKSLDEKLFVEDVVRVPSYGEGIIHLSDNVRINVRNKKKLANWGIFGKSGMGKTTALMIIANQHKNALIFDSKGGAIDLIKEYGIEGWEFYRIGEGMSKAKQLKINVFDLAPTTVNILYSGASALERRRIRRLTSFLNIGTPKPKKKRKKATVSELMEKKNYDNFMELLEAERLEFLADELSIILHNKDKGMPLEELCRGKKIIDVSTYDYRNRSIGVLVDSLFYRIRMIPELQSERLLIGTDDIQRIGESHMAFGKAMGVVFSQCRQYNVSGLVAGTNLTKLDPLIKGNISILLIFETDYDKEALWKLYGVDFDEYTLQQASNVYGRVGTALIKAPEFGYEDGKVFHFDLKYLKKPKPKIIRRQAPLETFAVDCGWV